MSCSSSKPPSFCTDASPELKLYQAFIFSVPIFFTFILLVLFYVFYLRRRRANWASLRMRISYQARGDMPRLSESGIKKEVREMLPVVVFRESFLIRETQGERLHHFLASKGHMLTDENCTCSVCLGDYKSDERLKRIPPCGHTFHVDCIDHWLSTRTTCPLCRVSLIPAAKAPADAQDPGPGSQADEAEEPPRGSGGIDRERRSGREEPGRGTEPSVSDGENPVVIDVESVAGREGGGNRA